MKRRFRRFVCLSLAVAMTVPPQAFVQAEDTDLFTGSPPTSGNPNVLIIIDNSANWAAQSQHWSDDSTQGQSELRAIKTILDSSLVNENINLGLMMLTAGTGQDASDPGWQNKDGGFMRFAIRPMNTTNKNAFKELIGEPNCQGATPGVPIYNSVATSTRNCIFQNASSGTLNESVGSNSNYDNTMFEAFKYFGGYTNPTGAAANPQVAGTPVDRSHYGPLRFAGNPDGRDDSAAFLNGSSGARVEYISPITEDNNCGKNYIIFIGNGFPQQGGGNTDQSLLTGVSGDATQMALPVLSTSTQTVTQSLGSRPAGTCETQAACASAAQTQFTTQYDTYSCTGGTQASVQTATDNFCESQADCLSRAQTTFPGYASYSCTGGTSGGGQTTTIGSYAVCSTNAQCVSEATSQGTASGLVSPFSCTGGSSTGITNPFGGGTTSGNVCETAAACSARMTSLLPAGSGLTATCSGGNTDPPACTGQNRLNQTVTYSCTSAGTLFNQTMQGTTTGCAAPNLQGQTMTATPAQICSGSNFLGQTMQGTKSVVTVTATGGTSPPTGSEPRYADEWAKYLFTTDVSSVTGIQNVRTFTIDVFKDAQDIRQSRLLYNMAKAGGGEYHTASSYQQILDALTKILIDIQAENSVFSAASLPVSATNRAQNENQVFFGMFRPDGSAKPRWYGNLKRYQVAQDATTKELFLADKNGSNAVALSTGFFSPCAESFWTVDSGTYWQNVTGAAQQECATAPGAVYSDLPDGPQVEKGGAAQVVRRGNDPPTTATTPTYVVNRTMYTCADTATCPTGTSPGMVTFNTTNVTQAAVGAANATDHANLINYTRGQDVASDVVDEQGNGITTDTRASIHGDVVHSRPLPVNYAGAGAYQSTGVVIYYGGNDGPFRAVRSSDGKELWSFIAPEHHSRLKRLWENDPLVKYPNVLDASAQRKDYFFDGTMGLFQNSDNSKIWIYPSMRRGGRMIYAFDITNPESPVLGWRAGCPNSGDDVGCTTGMADIGQTWSTPSVGFVKGYNGGFDADNPNDPNATPILVVGGGYDNCEDSDISLPSCSSAKGRKVFVLDAFSGTLLASFDTDRSVAADIALLERDFDGNVDHAYITDTGGNLYRIDFVNASTKAALPKPADPLVPAGACGSTPTAWCITKIANTQSVDGRKFLFPPAVLFGKSGSGEIAILTVGSGDRERPLYTNYPFVTPVLNRFYAFVDLFSTDSAAAINFDTSSAILDITTTPLTPPNCIPNIRGWRMDLTGGSADPLVTRGEQTVTSSLISGGRVFFNTHRALQPAAGVCNADLGEARGYSVDLFCGDKFSVVYEGGGIPISPVQGTVTLPSGQVVTFIIGGPGSPTQTNPYTPGQVKPVIAPVRKRLYWYRHGDK